MSEYINTLIFDNNKGIRISIPLPLNSYNDLEYLSDFFKGFSDDIYEMYREAYFSNDYKVKLTIINYDGKNLGSGQIEFPKIDFIMYDSEYKNRLNTNLFDLVFKSIADILNFKYLLCRGTEIIVLYRKDLSRYNGNFKEVYGKLYDFCRKMICDSETKNRVRELYPEIKITKFSFFCPEPKGGV